MSSSILYVLVSVRDDWSKLYDNQVAALKDFLKKYNSRGMYTMGSSPDPVFDCMLYGRDPNGIKYSFCARLSDNTFFIQLGDGKYHELIIVHRPIRAIDAPKGKNVWERSDSFMKNMS